MGRGLAACLLAAAAAACSPFGNGETFYCQADRDCVSPTLGAGTCPVPGGTCVFGPGSGSGSSDLGIDAGPTPSPEAGAPLVDARYCYGQTLQVCTSTEPSGTRNLAVMLDTDDDCDFTQAQGADQPVLCVIEAKAVTMTSLTVHGSRPLVIVASDSIDVNITVSASSATASGVIGPGADDPVCAPLAATKSGAGGAGAGFGGAGGPGGAGDSQGPTTGGAATDATFVRAGCQGEAGKSAGGHGGGAIYLLAGSSIAIAGTLEANGGGGTGGPAAIPVHAGGGGGGGTGGFIGLEAPSINATFGIVLARGGAGGGGGGTGGAAMPTAGGAGDDGDKAGSGAQATGGKGGTTAGGAGGVAAAVAGSGGSGGAGGAGGGGGGGGDGVIWITTRTGGLTGGTFLPAATTPP